MFKELKDCKWLLWLLIAACSPMKEDSIYFTSNNLKIYSVSSKVYVHKSYLETESFGKVGCNGLIYVNNGKAIIFDTPADDATSVKLIEQVVGAMKAEIVAVIPTHFHGDCLGGLSAFHKIGVDSYANELTIELAEEAGEIVPANGFKGGHSIIVGGAEVKIKHVGEGHTRDNVVGYIPTEAVLFGGCLVKNVGAGQGYTGDANLNEWSNTVTNVKSEFPDAKVIIPGHGQWGGQDLLDYTIELFKK